jgi:hypothetical protein
MLIKFGVSAILCDESGPSKLWIHPTSLQFRFGCDTVRSTTRFQHPEIVTDINAILEVGIYFLTDSHLLV